MAYTEVEPPAPPEPRRSRCPAHLVGHPRSVQRRGVRRRARRTSPPGQLSSLFSLRVDLRRAPGGRLRVPDGQPRTERRERGALTETATLNAAGLVDFPALAGPVPLDSGTYGYPATVATGLPSWRQRDAAAHRPQWQRAHGRLPAPLRQRPLDPQAGCKSSRSASTTAPLTPSGCCSVPGSSTG